MQDIGDGLPSCGTPMKWRRDISACAGVFGEKLWSFCKLHTELSVIVALPC